MKKWNWSKLKLFYVKLDKKHHVTLSKRKDQQKRTTGASDAYYTMGVNERSDCFLYCTSF